MSPILSTPKQMLALCRYALTALSKINTKTVRIELRPMFEQGALTYFVVTIFEQDGNNTGFAFYGWTALERNNNNLREVINIIKTDDFLKIAALKIEH